MPLLERNPFATPMAKQQEHIDHESGGGEIEHHGKDGDERRVRRDGQTRRQAEEPKVPEQQVAPGELLVVTVGEGEHGHQLVGDAH